MLLGFGFYMLHGCIQVYVTELAPTARGTAMSAHTAFFFFGQAMGPVVYGLFLDSIGIMPVLLFGAVAIAITGWFCALGAAATRRASRDPRTVGTGFRIRSRATQKSAAAAIGRDALVRRPDILRQFAGLPEHVDRNAAARIPVAADA